MILTFKVVTQICACILYTLLPIHVPIFMRLAFIVFKLSKDQDFQRTDGLTEGKPIVPFGVNPGRGLISHLSGVYM